jgi:hypothetical protein
MDGQGAGNLSGRRAAQAVADKIDAMFFGIAE